MVEIKRDKSAYKFLMAKLEQLDGHESKVGWFEQSKYKDGTPVAYIAAIQEYGCPEKNIPPRLGMRFTAKAKKPEWMVQAKAAAQKILNGGLNGKQAMEGLAMIAHADVLQRIKSNPPPPLAESTLASRKARGRGTQTLNDSGYMISTLNYSVDGGIVATSNE